MFKKKELCNKFIIYDNANIREAIGAIENGGIRIALVLNQQHKLIGTISDGDIRRGLLKGLQLESSLESIVQTNFISASLQTKQKEIIKLMKENVISQIPIIGDNNELIGLEISDDLIPKDRNVNYPNAALLMAGGRGLRLRPLTDACPKPLLNINGKPILEIILDQCIEAGIKEFYISVYYLAEMIKEYFGDGSNWGVKIQYIEENAPLGTAGALKLLPKSLKHPFLVINGDVLTKINYEDVLKYHSVNHGDITICVREHILSSPYGVIEVEGINFKSMMEKPSFKHLVNAGIYVLNPSIIDFVENNKFLDMPDLITSCEEFGKKIIVYPLHEYWLDVGKPESLDKANFEWNGYSVSS